MLPRWFTPITVAIIAGMSLWLLSSQAPQQPQLFTLEKSVPDAFMEKFITHDFDESGNPRHEIKADHMAHYPVGDISEFTLPELILYQPGDIRWVVSAEKATATKDIQQIILTGKVSIERLDKITGNSDLSIRTRDLLIRPNDNYIETEYEIDISSGKSRVQSVGIRANLNEGRVELLSRVRGVYEL